MELSSFQRIVSFTAIVIVMAGLVVYLFVPSASGTSGSPGPAAQGASRTPAGGSSTPPGGSPGPSASASPSGWASPSAPPVPFGHGQVPDIYQWLPFSQKDLASAADVAVRFGDDYDTYSYAEPVASYLAPMRPIVTSQLAGLLGRAYATPGLVAVRTSGKQTSTASTAILSLRAFGSTSLTFVVEITERISVGGGGGGSASGSGGTSEQVLDYAVTLTGSGTTWQVSDIEPASAGNS